MRGSEACTTWTKTQETVRSQKCCSNLSRFAIHRQVHSAVMSMDRLRNSIDRSPPKRQPSNSYSRMRSALSASLHRAPHHHHSPPEVAFMVIGPKQSSVARALPLPVSLCSYSCTSHLKFPHQAPATRASPIFFSRLPTALHSTINSPRSHSHLTLQH